MSKAVIILEDDIDEMGEPTINIKIKFFRNDEREGTDEHSSAQHMGIKMLRVIADE